MSTKTLWAAALTGLVGCIAFSHAADPVAPGTLVPMPASAQTRIIVASPYGVAPTSPPVAPAPLKPAETKWTEGKVPVADRSSPPAPEGKTDQPTVPPSDLRSAAPPASVLAPGGESCGSACSNCGGCATTCESCGGHRLLGGCGSCGKLRAWLSYHPRTPPGDCAGDYRIPDIYTYFLDVPCRTSWKPVECERLCGKCGQCGQACTFYLTVFAPTPPPPPAPGVQAPPAPAPELLPAPKTAPGRGFATDR